MGSIECKNAMSLKKSEQQNSKTCKEAQAIYDRPYEQTINAEEAKDNSQTDHEKARLTREL